MLLRVAADIEILILIGKMNFIDNLDYTDVLRTTNIFGQSIARK